MPFFAGLNAGGALPAVRLLGGWRLADGVWLMAFGVQLMVEVKWRTPLQNTGRWRDGHNIVLRNIKKKQEENHLLVGHIVLSGNMASRLGLQEGIDHLLVRHLSSPSN